jgi:hypothetical protein
MEETIRTRDKKCYVIKAGLIRIASDGCSQLEGAAQAALPELFIGDRSRTRSSITGDYGGVLYLASSIGEDACRHR